MLDDFLTKSQALQKRFILKNNFLSALLIKFNFNQDKKFLCAKKIWSLDEKNNLKKNTISCQQIRNDLLNKLEKHSYTSLKKWKTI